jgi:hypothetical protein
MSHPLVLQLRFTRSEFKRALDGVTDSEALHRFMPINSISWIVAHLTWQEQLYWLTRAQKRTIEPKINTLAGYGRPASTPPLDEMWQAWQAVTQEADIWLDTLTTEKLTTFMPYDERQSPESIGSMLRRVTYHYWFHIGESQAIRQMLGHTDLPEFVGALHAEAPYIPE